VDSAGRSEPSGERREQLLDRADDALDAAIQFSRSAPLDEPFPLSEHTKRLLVANCKRVRELRDVAAAHERSSLLLLIASIGGLEITLRAARLEKELDAFLADPKRFDDGDEWEQWPE